ncbi:MAG TPA: response regulator transcription factor [Gaiellaceae bacterium]|nr:response regulator transcription factor [Gaiellaceae bacterium]
MTAKAREARSSISVVVADDHPAILRAVESLLDRLGFRVPAIATDGESALDAVRSHRPSVCVADLRMPELDGLQIARRVRELGLPTRVVVYSGAGDPTTGTQALAVGAHGVVLKSAPLVDLVRAIEVVASGRVYVDPQLAGNLIAGDGQSRPLTSRESEILHLLAEGRSYASIAHTLHISAETVRTHAKHAKTKLGARTRTHAVALALRDSLIT